MKISFDSGVRTPLCEQIEKAIENMITERRFAPGSKLPSLRQIAAQSGVSLFPVTEAYDRLLSRGLIRSRPGAGYFVETDRIPVLDHVRRYLSGGQDSERENAIQRFNSPGDNLKLGSGFVPEPWLDTEGISTAIRHVARESGSSLVSYGSPLGNAQLRAALLHHVAHYGIHASMEEIILTTGVTHGLDLIARRFVQRGDTVLVDDPGYFNLFKLLRLQGAHVIGVPRLPNGPDLDVLEQLLEQHRPKFYFVNGVLHNPTGTTIELRVGMRMMSLAERYDLTIVEDDINADFEFTPSDRLAKLGERDRVIYVGGMSKSLSPSLRIGYVIASPAVIKVLAEVKGLTMIGCSPFSEAVVFEWLRRGQYRKHMERLRVRLQGAMHNAMQVLDAAGWEVFAQPRGGSLLWARRPGIDDSQALAKAAERHAVTIAPGSHYRVDDGRSPWLRINVAYAADPRALDFFRQAHTAPGDAVVPDEAR